MRDLFRLEPSGNHGDHLGLPIGQPGRTLQAGSSLTCRLDHGCDCVGVEAAGRRLAGECLRRPLGGSGWTVRPRLRHRVVGIRGGEQPGGKGELGAGRPPVVAGAVEALVVRSGDRRQGGEKRRAREDALRVVRV